MKICDRTLSCLDGYFPSGRQLQSLAQLFFQCGADRLELSEEAYRTMGKLPDTSSFVLRIRRPEYADRYPEFDSFICEYNPYGDRRIRTEIHVRDNESMTRLLHSGIGKNSREKLRLTGWDDLFRFPVESSLQRLKSCLAAETEFCPGNSLKCGSAAAVEWIHADAGDTIVTSFGGIGGFAPFEQVLTAMRKFYGRRPEENYPALPRIRDLMEKITGKKSDIRQPVTGRGIFTVESGIHVSGILKYPGCYEPFPPESVGMKRKFTYGRFSGRDAIRHKLDELGISASAEELQEITQQVKRTSRRKNRSLSDDEVRETAEYIKSGRDLYGETQTDR